MNNFYSQPEIYYERWLTPLLQRAAEQHQVIVLTGARQVGKSTLLRQAEPFKQWRYQTLDDFDTLRQATENPAALWAGAAAVVLDEVQKAPQLFPAVKKAVDERPGRLRFVLSGSANLLLMQQVSESLAGRAVYFILNPMTLGEIKTEKEILKYSIEMRFLVRFALENGDLEYANIVANRYMVDVWFNQRDSLLGTDLDIAAVKPLFRQEEVVETD